MGKCEDCKHAVFGSLGNYCKRDKHEIRSQDTCTIANGFEVFISKSSVDGNTYPCNPDKCAPGKCDGCKDANLGPAWWDPTNNLTQLQQIVSKLDMYRGIGYVQSNESVRVRLEKLIRGLLTLVQSGCEQIGAGDLEIYRERLVRVHPSSGVYLSIPFKNHQEAQWAVMLLEKLIRDHE